MTVADPGVRDGAVAVRVTGPIIAPLITTETLACVAGMVVVVTTTTAPLPVCVSVTSSPPVGAGAAEVIVSVPA